MNIVDRRPNPKGKSLSNRQRFLGRAQADVKRAVADIISKGKVRDPGTQSEKISIPTRGLSEPQFHHARQIGKHDIVVPGNKEYVKGDDIPRPQGGGQGGGREGSPDGSGDDAFEFTLTKEEFLEHFFDDLELPDLVKKSLRDTTAFEIHRAGDTITETGSLNIRRTMRIAMGRRIALRRPKLSELEAKQEAFAEAKEELASLEADDNALPEAVEKARLAFRVVGDELAVIERRRKVIGYVDPLDVRYKRFEKVPKPNTEAVMFCLMDVSGSMTEQMKDLAKRFFMLLHVFLMRRYKHVDVVFIRHTATAEEVDEEKFFYGRETGGTVVSTALQKMIDIARDCYPTNRWNVYGTQASDGDNYGADSSNCVKLLGQEILPMVQHFAYIEVGDGMGGGLSGLSRDSDLWRAYNEVKGHGNFAMRRVGTPAQIFGVFHDLFSKSIKGLAAMEEPSMHTVRFSAPDLKAG